MLVVLCTLQMREYIRGRLEKAVHNYDTDSQSRSLMDFIQANVRLSLSLPHMIDFKTLIW